MATPIYAYTDEAGLATSINPNALIGVSSAMKTSKISEASRIIDSYLRAQYTLPLTQVGEDVRGACEDIAVYLILCSRGFNPDADSAVKDKNDQALAWLRDIAKGIVAPDITDSSVASAEGRVGAQPMVVSGSSRGLSARDSSSCGRWPFQGD